MKEQKNGTWSYVTAAVMAALILPLFFIVQDFGPESAIRRFNQAIADADTTAMLRGNASELQKVDGELQKVTIDKIRGRSDWMLILNLAELYSRGATMQIADVERSDSQVRAAVLYRVPQGNSPAMVWVVQRRGKRWFVDAHKTATILSDNLGIRNPVIP